jgi:hypothetical protein
MDFLTDFELFNQILVSPDHVTLVYSFSFSSIQITVHIKINISQPIIYLYTCKVVCDDGKLSVHTVDLALSAPTM